jgi:tetratricopeptide (TPR) repeat protein
MHPGDVFADRFEIERFAGAGGMGTVYRVLDRRTRGNVALKVLEGERTAREEARFQREARLLSELSHPGIVRYLDHGVTPAGEPYLVMEWLEGEELSERLLRGPLSIEEAVILGRRVSEALSAAHERGVLHRDIKPRNLFLSEGAVDLVKVLDFGIARISSAPQVMTRTGAVVGTVGYMAPEQARGEPDADARVDVFSLGCVLFEALTGRAPFEGLHVLAVLAKILIEDAPRVGELRPSVPRALEDLVARMLSKDPAKRPTDGAAVAMELRAIEEPATLRLGAVARSTPVLTGNERRLLNLIMAAGPLHFEGPPTSRTLSPEEAARPFQVLRAAAQPFGVHLLQLAGGSALATLFGQGSATDQAARAARCALAMRAALPSLPLVLATGPGVFDSRVPVGEVIDRAVGLLRQSPAVGAAIRLDEVTAGLLDDRFEVASDAAGFELRGERPAIEHTTRTLLGKPTPCVGRDRELAMLEATFAECHGDSVARVVLVTGPPGAGKSRVRYEFVREVRRRGEPVSVWIARGDPMSAGEPLGMVAELVRGAAGILAGEPISLRRDKLRARVAQRVPSPEAARVTEFLGELAGTRFPEEESPPLSAARRDAMLMGNQMRRAFEDFVTAESEARTVLMVLDDLHWGDLPSVQFIDGALRRGQERPLMVLGLARPDVHALFPKLWADSGAQEIRLGELSRKASERLCRQVLGDEARSEDIERVIAQAAGNAFYLEELIRAVAAGKSAALPETVLAMAQARIEALSPEERRVLRAGSVFGGVFWVGGVSALLGDPGAVSMTREWLAALVDREFIVRQEESRFPEEEQYAFRHTLVREAAYGMLTEGDRTLGHRLAGGWLERVGEQGAMTLAEHFERGAVAARAVVFYAEAAEQALEADDLAAAIARAERGIVSGAAGEALGRLRLLQAEAHRWRGDSAEATRSAAAALNEAARGSVLWCAAASEMSASAIRLGEPEMLERIGLDLCAVADEAGFDAPGIVTGSSMIAAQIIACARVAAPLFVLGRYALAERLIACIDRAPRELFRKDPLLRARAFETRAHQALSAGDPGAFIGMSREAAGGFVEVGDIRNAAVQLSNLALAQSWLGAYAAAEEDLLDVLALGERMGLSAIVCVARQNLGYVIARLGRLDEARALSEQSVTEAKAQGDRRLEVGARIYLAITKSLAGDHREADKEATAAVQMLARKLPLRAYALGVLAQIKLCAGSPAQALSIAEEAMSLLESLGGAIEEGEAVVRLAYAEALLANGHPKAAQAIAEARRRLEERAANLRDPAWRESFLTRVPENVRTLELSRTST